MATAAEIARQEYSLSIPLYVKRTQNGAGQRANESATLPQLWAEWEESGRAFWLEIDELVVMLDGLVSEETAE